MKDDTRTSKFLSLVLRHRPEKIDLHLDKQGWTNVAELLTKMAAAGHRITPTDLERIVAESDKQRYALSADGKRIRANQGHSIEIDLGLKKATPPILLYHGTAERFIASINKRGLVKGKRHHVHLSADRETAALVGKRHGKLVILTIKARAMLLDGHNFYQSKNGVWLTDSVPTKYFA